jgi:hypothetical protein
MAQQPKSLSRVLQNNRGTLRDILSHATFIEQLNDVLLKHLPGEYAGHCQAVTLRQYILVVAADTPAWAARMRYFSAELLIKLRQEPVFRNLKKIQIRVVPRSLIPRTPPPEQKYISGKSASVIQDAVKSIKDPKLKKSLLKLARNKQK